MTQTTDSRPRALETFYNGFRFRSRLEARWAIFFDALGVAYQYEKEGFDLDGAPYLPDFYLPERSLWVEVKPDPRNADLSKPVALARLTGEPAVVLGDIRGDDDWGPHHLMVGYERSGPLSVTWFSWLPIGPEAGGVLEEPHGYPRFVGDENVMPNMWATESLQVKDHLIVGHAYSSARHARFEHGEIPRQRRSCYLDERHGGAW